MGSRHKRLQLLALHVEFVLNNAKSVVGRGKEYIASFPGSHSRNEIEPGNESIGKELAAYRARQVAREGSPH